MASGGEPLYGIQNFKVCVWEGNAYQIKANSCAEFEEELLPANSNDFEVYYLRTAYSTQCNETKLPAPLSQLNCSKNNIIDSLGFRVEASQTIIPADLNVSLKREGCFGSCPIYYIEVLANGNVSYNGERFVCQEGKKTSTISLDKVRQLVDKINSMNYFGLDGSYTDLDQGAGDLPWQTTSVTINGQTKTLRHYVGDTSSPQSLTDLENLIDEASNSRRWYKFGSTGTYCALI